MVSRRVQAAVDAAIEAKPLPESVDDLDAQTRRQVDREAARRGVPAAEVWAEVRRADSAQATTASAAAEIVAKIRGRGARL